MKSTKKDAQKVDGINPDTKQNELKITKKRVTKPALSSNKAGTNAASEISKIVLRENDQNNYDISITFSDNLKPGDFGNLNESDVKVFFSNLFASLSKQANPTLRSPIPRPPKITEMTF